MPRRLDPAAALVAGPVGLFRRRPRGWIRAAVPGCGGGQVPFILGVGPYSQVQGGFGVVGGLQARGLVDGQAVLVGSVQLCEWHGLFCCGVGDQVYDQEPHPRVPQAGHHCPEG